MSSKERRKREKKQRRANIIAAAERLILEKGLEQVTMSAIAIGAEVSKGTLYLYFSSKDELVYAINSKGLSSLNGELSKILSQHNSGKEMIEALWKLGLRYPDEHPVFVEAFRYYEFHTQLTDIDKKPIVKECEEQRQRLFVFTKRILQIAMQDGSVKSDYEPKMLTIILWSGIRGILEMVDDRSTATSTPLLQELKDKKKAIYEAHLEIVMNGITQS